SAVSRVYVSRSLWHRLEERLKAIVGELLVGDPAEYKHFMGAVIGRHAFERISSYQKLAREQPSCRIVAGGGGSDKEGFFIEPTIVEVSDPKHRLMQEEIFGPLVSVFVYDDARFEDALTLCETSTPYALTGAIFAESRQAIEQASRRLRF